MAGENDLIENQRAERSERALDADVHAGHSSEPGLGGHCRAMGGARRRREPRSRVPRLRRSQCSRSGGGAEHARPPRRNPRWDGLGQGPCSVRAPIGGVCLIMRFAPRTGGYVEEERTVHDGGALWHAAQRAVQDAVNKARQGPSPEAPPLGGQFPPPRPAAGMPSDLGATIPMDNQLAFRDAAKTISSAPPPADDSPTTVRATAVGAPPPRPPSRRRRSRR